MADKGKTSKNFDAMETFAPKRLQSELISDQLEAEIIAGTLPAGSKLDELALTSRFGVSRTPVREALHHLVSRCLAERMPYRGVVVANISRERIDNLFETMSEIEAICGRLAAERMTVSEQAALDDLHQSMVTMAEEERTEDYERANTAFHTAIFEGTRNAELLALAHGMRLKLAPFRKSQLKAVPRVRKSNQEHTEIVTAILDRDAKQAERALRRHLLSAAKAVLSQMG